MTSEEKLKLIEEFRAFPGSQGVFGVCYITGKGLCGLMDYLTSRAILYGLQIDPFQLYEGRFCFQDRNRANTTLIEWMVLEEQGKPVPQVPENAFWIKHKPYPEFGNYRHPDFKEWDKHEKDYLNLMKEL